MAARRLFKKATVTTKQQHLRYFPCVRFPRGVYKDTAVPRDRTSFTIHWTCFYSFFPSIYPQVWLGVPSDDTNSTYVTKMLPFMVMPLSRGRVATLQPIKETTAAYVTPPDFCSFLCKLELITCRCVRKSYILLVPPLHP